jgi:prepilin-type N-terminal cleavage/methylation domain-containing protein
LWAIFQGRKTIALPGNVYNNHKQYKVKSEQKGVGTSMNFPNKTKGFTIIEVVLVLAIAGLIFLVVFLALPTLQRSQRDTQRKQDLGKLMSQVTSYQSNNQGGLPNGAWDSTFKTNYLPSPFADPTDGTTYVITQQASAPAAPPAPGVHNIYIYPGMTCGGVNGVQGTWSLASRTFAALMYQEQGVYTCQSNN